MTSIDASDRETEAFRPPWLRAAVDLWGWAGLDFFMLLNAVRAAGQVDLWTNPDFMAVYKRVYPYTMTRIENVHALYQAVRHLVRNEVNGDFVECGVWRGGSSMTIALALLSLPASERRLVLYDTFEGMPRPTAEDGPVGIPWQSDSFAVALETVRDNIASTGFPLENLDLVKGRVEDALPRTTPSAIALLRLDTDFYRSTLCELEHLYPLISPGGVLVVDDYGAFRGCRRAVDEYFERNNVDMLLHRIDDSARIGIKRSSQ